MSENKKKNSPLKCVYCAEEPAVSRDHVVPKCLFGEKLPEKSQMITVKSCISCNQGRSDDERYFRDILYMESLNYDYSLNPQFLKKLAENIGTEKSKPGKIFMNQARLYDLGLLSDFGQIPVDDTIVQRVFNKMVRGLYYYFWERRIPPSYHIKAFKFKPATEMYDVVQKYMDCPDHKIVVLGDEEEIFGCIGVRDFEIPYQTRWFFSFYRKIIYIAASEPPIRLIGPIADKIWGS